MARQYTTSSYAQALPSPQTQPWMQPILQAPQRSPVPGGSKHPHPSVNNDTAWQILSNDRKRWDPNTPEPIRRDGESILMNFTLRGDNTIYCRVPAQNGHCNHKNEKKERMLHHMRKDHLSFFPFPCGGGCRSPTWYVV